MLLTFKKEKPKIKHNSYYVRIVKKYQQYIASLKKNEQYSSLLLFLFISLHFIHLKDILIQFYLFYLDLDKSLESIRITLEYVSCTNIF